MKENKKYYFIIWLVLFAVFNLIIFIMPNKVFGITRFDKTTFWIAYVLVVIAYIGHLVVAKLLINNNDTLDKTFMNLSLIKINISSIIISTIVGMIFMSIPILPAWLGSIICILILAYVIIAMCLARSTSNKALEVEGKVKEKTEFIKLLISEASILPSLASTKENKILANKVYDAIKYSDPMSNEKLEAIEVKIKSQYEEFKEALIRNDENVSIFMNTLLLSIKERNSKCKLFK